MIRFFDIFFSLIGLILISPLFMFIIIILRFTGEGEIFYRQERIGLNRKKFYIFKFPTMLKNSPNLGTKTLTIGDDPRILPFGKILRKSKINELPQILNIFLGDMSLIGPRPLTPDGFLSYNKKIQIELIKIRPGLSGIGSIVFSNEESLLKKNKNPIIFWKNVISPYKGDLELWYTNNISLLNYFILILLTLTVLMKVKKINVFTVFKTLPKPPLVLKNLPDFLFK